MEIKIIKKEETGRVRYVAVDVEVVDGDVTYELSGTVSETYDNNNGSSDKKVESVIWETDSPGSSKEIDIEEAVYKRLESEEI